MKPRRKRDSGNLDSLLDTMTSVVGILVIMLIVIQLDVGSAVRRIIRERDQRLPEVGPAQLALAAARLEEVAGNRDRLAREVEEMRRAMSREDELARLQEQLAAVEKQLAEARKRNQDERMLLEALKKLREELARLEKDIQDRQKEINRLKAMLATTPKPRAPPAKVVRLPDPKKAPAGARPVYFLCRGGKLYHVDLAALKKEVAEGIRRSNAKKNRKGEFDGERIAKFFSMVPVGDRTFRVGARVRNYHLNFWIERRKTGGENAAALRSRFSGYQKILDKMDPAKQYAVFITWPDGYETYLLAREIAAAKGILGGWRPEIRKEDWSPHLGHFASLDSHKAKKPGPSKPRDPRIPSDVID